MPWRPASLGERPIWMLSPSCRNGPSPSSLASSAYAAKVDAPSAILGTNVDCTGAQSATCGDVLIGTVGTTPGGPIEYGCSTLDYDGCTEAVYEICVAADDQLSVEMTYAHDGSLNDLDLFLLGSCDAVDCLDSLSCSNDSCSQLLPAATTAPAQ